MAGPIEEISGERIVHTCRRAIQVMDAIVNACHHGRVFGSEQQLMALHMVLVALTERSLNAAEHIRDVIEKMRAQLESGEKGN